MHPGVDRHRSGWPPKSRDHHCCHPATRSMPSLLVRPILRSNRHWCTVRDISCACRRLLSAATRPRVSDREQWTSETHSVVQFHWINSLGKNGLRFHAKADHHPPAHIHFLASCSTVALSCFTTILSVAAEVGMRTPYEGALVRPMFL